MERLNRLFLLARAVFHRIFHSPTLSGQPRKILVIQTAKMGDMVCTTPMFRAIKKQFPTCQLTIMGDKVNQQILSHHPHVDQYILWDKSRPLATLEQIRSEQFDFGCATAPNFEALALLVLGGVKTIVVPKIEGGWSPYETKPYRLLRLFVTTAPHRFGTYAPREYLRLLEPLGILTDDTRKLLVHSPESEEKINEFLSVQNITQDRIIVGITPVAGNKIKEWPLERFAEVANRLGENPRVALLAIGGPQDKDKVAEFLSLIKPDIEVTKACHFNVDELKALVSKLSLFISVDTGPIYIAEAYGVPTVDIVGPMDEREQPPVGPLHRVVSARKEGERAVLHIMNARAYDTDVARRQTEAITVEQVMAEVDSLLDSLSHVTP